MTDRTRTTADLARRRMLRGLALFPLVPLAGCGPAARLIDASGPGALYTLTPAREFAAGLQRVSWQLLVETPLANTGIDTVRIALSENANRLTYYSDATWIDTAPKMIQQLLIESFDNSNRIVAVGREASGLRADFVLKTDIRDFQATYPGGEPGEVPAIAKVRINAKLVRMPRRIIVASDTFRAEIMADLTSFASTVSAFDIALETVMRRIVEWSLRQGALSMQTDPPPAAAGR